LTCDIVSTMTKSAWGGNVASKQAPLKTAGENDAWAAYPARARWRTLAGAYRRHCNEYALDASVPTCVDQNVLFMRECIIHEAHEEFKPALPLLVTWSSYRRVVEESWRVGNQPTTKAAASAMRVVWRAR
jgi:hypothetical protein